MPNENHHSEGAAGKAAYHRQCCSDGMLSHQGEFSLDTSSTGPHTRTSALRRPFNSGGHDPCLRCQFHKVASAWIRSTTQRNTHCFARYDVFQNLSKVIVTKQPFTQNFCPPKMLFPSLPSRRATTKVHEKTVARLSRPDLSTPILQPLWVTLDTCPHDLRRTYHNI